jgi:type I restriction enzyme R subunit
MVFNSELEFEKQLIKSLIANGWEESVLQNPTEENLIENWANILFDNNRQRDRLGDYPLTNTEMQQILEQVVGRRTPIALNAFINGKTISIKRDNPNDKAHLGKEISLKIYDRQEIAAGQSRYQIAEQPIFKTKSDILPDRRGDFVLLINGMPVIHVELKKSGIPVSQAYNQIEKYSHEGVFTGLFSLVQVFVAMNPEETVYFSNPGPDGNFNPDFYFHWADFNNEPINDWKTIATTLLHIPMAHQLIGFYTVADASDGVLKVMRSYQYYAANAISDKVSKIKWGENNQLGGYIWHTTGSGKTMTSFKSAQLIANSKDADKVVFLTDRIELGTQSLKEYKNFADDREDIQDTENTRVLVSKLKSDDAKNTLIVTSIQKMSNIQLEEGGLNAKDIELINKKRIVFIVDEAHRDTFGIMLSTIKNTFPRAIFFGFTGTPIQVENQKKNSTTATIFGNELHRYSIADGIRDKNVLGFDLDKISTFKENDLRRAVALDMAKADTEIEAINDPAKRNIYYNFMNSVPMAGYTTESGKYVKGIEDYLPKSQYLTNEHQNKVIEDIKDNWIQLSHAGKFHALFATNSIHEAIEYYHLFKNNFQELKVTALFDPSIDNEGGFKYKEDNLVEIIEDYNKRYNQTFTISTYAAMKKDISFRLAHKEQYKIIDRTPNEEIDLLIVVDQMLTGFDSKWVNTLYLDKVLRYENVIQAFSRTNRLFGPIEKPFGTIRYYRMPFTMGKNIESAVKLYSGDKPFGLFVDKLPKNLQALNDTFDSIVEIYKQAGIEDFHKLPDEQIDKVRFAKLFNKFNEILGAAIIQGFKWDKDTYVFLSDSGLTNESITVHFTQEQYDMLVSRYKELERHPGAGSADVPYDINGYLTEIETESIDNEYMNDRFHKYLHILFTNRDDKEKVEQALSELHKSFATLSQEQQKYANIFLHDIDRGQVDIQKGKSFKDYVIEYQYIAKNNQIHVFAETFGLDENRLRSIMSAKVTSATINEFGRLDELKATVDKEKARKYFEKSTGEKISTFKINIKVDELLRKFILTDGFEISNE